MMANTEASIYHHVEKGNGHQIMNAIKSRSKEWDVKKVYPELEHPSDHGCRNNIPIIDRVFTKRLGLAALASNTFTQTLISHLSETIQERIQLTAKKLDNFTSSADQITYFFDIAITQYKIYFTYSILAALVLMLLCVLVFCWRLRNALSNLINIIDNNDIRLRALRDRQIYPRDP